MPKLLEPAEDVIDAPMEVPDQKWSSQIFMESVQSAVSAVRLTGDRPEKAVMLAAFVGWDPSGNPLVDFRDNPFREPVAARSTVPLRENDLKKDVVLLFPDDDRRHPVVIGIVQPLKEAESAIDKGTTEPTIRVEADGQRLVLKADREIVLSCGEASITLTRAGKILIRGSYLLSRASGTNRIRGGSVQIN